MRHQDQDDLVLLTPRSCSRAKETPRSVGLLTKSRAIELYCDGKV